MDHIIRHLLHEKYITNQQLQECLQIQKHNPKLSLYHILVRHNVISSKKLQYIITQLKNEKVQQSSPNSRFGKYIVHESLGQGGMGTVYRAVDTNLQREVALKVLNHNQITDKQLKRFKREAVLMANLNHANIVKVFEANEEQGLPFIAMELIKGENLSNYMMDFDLVQKVHILIKVAKAIHFAHTQGVIHRDLKPENIMIDHQYQPTVMDFGLAKELHGEKLSRTGENPGTPLYMSPEQINGHNVDARADVYSLGIILYEMMVGKTPFAEKGSIYAILICEPTPPCDIDIELPKPLEAICLKAIEKKKNARYQTAKDFAQDLERYLRGDIVSAKHLTQFTRCKKWLLRNRKTIVSIMCFFALAITILFMWKNLSISQIRLTKEKLASYKARLKSYRDRLESQMILVQKHSMSAEYALTDEILEKMKVTTDTANKLLQEGALIDFDVNDKEIVALEKEIRYFEENVSRIPSAIALHCKYIPLENIYRNDEEYIEVPPNYTFTKSFQPSWDVIVTFDKVENRTYLLWRNAQTEWQKKPIIAVDAYAVNAKKNMIALFQEKERDIVLCYLANGVIQPINKCNSFINTALKNTPKSFNVLRFHFSPSGRWFFARVQKRSFLFDLKNLKKYDFVLQKRSMAAFSNDEQYLAITDYKGTSIFELSKSKKQPSRKIVKSGSSLCFNSQKDLLVGYFDIIRYYIQQNRGMDYVALNAHHKPITSLTMNPNGSFLASYSDESGELAIRQSNCETIIAKHFFRENTPDNSILLGKDKYGIWQREKVSIYKRKMNVKEIQFEQVITSGLKELLSLLEKKGYDIEGHHREELGDNFVRFSANGEYIFHVSLLYLHVYHIKSRKKYVFPLFALAFRESYFFRIKQVKIYQDRYVCAVGGKSQFGKEEKMLVVWDLQKKKRIFEKTHTDETKIQFNNGKLCYQILKSQQINTHELTIDNGSVMTQKIAQQNLPLKIKGKILSAFHQARMAFFAVEENRAGRNIVVVEEGNILYNLPVKIGRASTLKFITQDIIAIGSFFGEVALVYLKKKKVVTFNLRGVIKHFFFDKEHNALLVYNGLGLNVVPLYYNENDLFLKKIYPIQLFYNYKTHSICINDQIHKVAVALTNNFTLLIGK